MTTAVKSRSDGTSGGPRNPWRSRHAAAGSSPADRGRAADALDDLLRAAASGFGGGGGGGGRAAAFPGAQARALWPIGLPSSRSCGCCSPASTGSARRSAASSPHLGKYSRTLEPGIGLTLPSPIERVRDGRRARISAPSTSARQRRRGESDADRRPEHHRSRLFGALEHPRSASSTCSSSPSPKTRSARSPKARCARSSPTRIARPMRSAPAAAEIEQQVAAADAGDPRRLSVAACGSRASRSSRPIRPRRSNDAFKDVTAAQQEAQSRHQPGARLCAAAHRARAGRGRRVRQGLRAVPARARGDPAAHVLRDDGGGAAETSTRRSSRRRA